MIVLSLQHRRIEYVAERSEVRFHSDSGQYWKFLLCEGTDGEALLAHVAADGAQCATGSDDNPVEHEMNAAATDAASSAMVVRAERPAWVPEWVALPAGERGATLLAAVAERGGRPDWTAIDMVALVEAKLRRPFGSEVALEETAAQLLTAFRAHFEIEEAPVVAHTGAARGSTARHKRPREQASTTDMLQLCGIVRTSHV